MESADTDTAAIAALAALDVTDGRQAHLEADDILLRLVSPAVRAAYEHVRAEASFDYD